MKNILVPRNLEGRKEQLRQYRIRLLSQEVIEGNLDIDETFLDIPLELIKVKEIRGYVRMKCMHKIPNWLKSVKIYGYFDCSNNCLTSL